VGDNFAIPSKLCEDYGGVVASYGTSSYRPMAMMSRRHSNAVGTGNFSYFSKKNIFEKIKKKLYFLFYFSFFLSLIFYFL
jgi:hypothetical protein